MHKGRAWGCLALWNPQETFLTDFNETQILPAGPWEVPPGAAAGCSVWFSMGTCPKPAQGEPSTVSTVPALQWPSPGRASPCSPTACWGCCLFVIHTTRGAETQRSCPAICRD